MIFSFGCCISEKAVQTIRRDPQIAYLEQADLAARAPGEISGGGGEAANQLV